MTTPVPHFGGDVLPTFSPDGRKLAFVRFADSGGDIYILAVNSNNVAPNQNPKRLTVGERVIVGLDWAADSTELVFSSNRTGTSALWRVSAAGGPVQPIAGQESLYHVAVSGHAHRLAYTHVGVITSIRRAAGPFRRPTYSKAVHNSPVKLIASNAMDYAPQFSPDGKSIAFTSTRSGSSEIWVSDSEGLHANQLTSFGGSLWVNGSPR